MTESTTTTPNRSLNLKTETPTPETCKSSEHFNIIMNKIHDFFNEKKFCDVTLIAKDNIYQIEAHKMILCASSDVFLGMFGGSMREAAENKGNLDIEGPILELVIKYIYTASIELTADTVEDILRAACLLQLTPLKSLCCDFIVKQLDSSNCLGIALFAEQYNLDDLYKQSETFVCDNFGKLRKDEEFFKLDVYQLSKFLSSSDLRVDSEEDVFRSLMSWIDHDKTNREEFMSKLLHHVRFPLLTPKFIASCIEPSCKSIECERLICKAYKWHLLPEFRLSLYTEKHTQLRNFNGMVMAISGWSANGGALNIGLYYPVLNDWIYKSGIPALTFGREDFGSTSFKGKLIIAGGVLTTTKELTDRVDCLDLKTFKWSSLAPLNTKRKLFGMASLNGCIYAVGGCQGGVNFNTIEKYDPSIKQWKYVAPMNYSSPVLVCVSVTLNKLCVSIKTGQGMSTMYHHNLYDPANDTWTYDWLVTNDNLVGTGTVSVFSNDFFIAVAKNSILRYNYVIKSSEVISLGKTFVKGDCDHCEGFGDRMIAYGNNLFQEYNPFRDEWKTMPKFENTQGKVLLISNQSYNP
ncbi:kelch-like protein 5 [Episyrphus balteatus]|uniref:kelch-like protein 5 n=1 Tax=Episyrphus balteatus TaxID=286459 RepID=UPI0024853107|nr:kelch-like protein 5 [Episyrphus balteatus]